MKLTPAWVCRTGPPAYVACGDGTITLCQSQLYPHQSGTMAAGTGDKIAYYPYRLKGLAKRLLRSDEGFLIAEVRVNTNYEKKNIY